MATAKKQRAGERVKMTPDQREAFESLREGAGRIGEREARPLAKLGLIERVDANEQPEGMGRSERLAFRWRLTERGVVESRLPVRVAPERTSISFRMASLSVEASGPGAAKAVEDLFATLFPRSPK